MTATSTEVARRPPSNINPANAITASRFLALPVFLWSIDRGDPQVATLALLICGVMDLFDGAVARAFKCQTAFGEVFDAIADAICYGAMLVILMIYGWIPWPPVAIIVAFGVLNTGMRGIYAKRAGRTVNYRSVAMEKLVAYAGYLVGFGTSQMQVDYFFWTFVVLMAVTLIHDGKRMLIDPVDPVDPSEAAPNALAEVAA